MAELSSLGFGRTMIKKLHTVDIHTAEDLAEAGSRQTVSRLRARYPGVCVVILYYLEAALRGVEIQQPDPACKAELRAYFKRL